MGDVRSSLIPFSSHQNLTKSDAEYCTLRQEAAVPLPENMDKAEMAPLLCAGVTVFNSIRLQKIPQGGIVGVVGLGGYVTSLSIDVEY